MRTVDAADEKSVYLEGAGSTYYYIDWTGFSYPIPGYRVFDVNGKQLGVVRSARLHADTPTPTSVYYASDVKKKTYVPSHETHDTKTFLVKK